MYLCFKRCFSVAKPHKVVVSIIGKPNVGKSTLFNRLSLSNRSLTHPTPGLTRDCLDITVYKTLKVPIELRDTPGIQYLEEKTLRAQFDSECVTEKHPTYTKEQYDEIAEQMLKRTKESISESDLLLFLIDGKAGISQQDKIISDWLKTNFKNLPIFLIANKIDNEQTEIAILSEIFQLGFESPIMISAEGGDNLHAIWELINRFVTPEKLAKFEALLKQRRHKITDYKHKFMTEVKALLEKNKDVNLDAKLLSREYDHLNKDLPYMSDLDDETTPIQNIILSPKVNDKQPLSYYNRAKNLPLKIALLGRPNSGKSTLFNHIIKNDRSVVHHVAHTTKDPVISRLVYKGRRIEMIDTAGIDRNLTSEEGSADYNVFYRNLSVLREAQIHVILVDAMNAFRVKDMDLIQRSMKEGRGIILLVNKWDLVDPKWHEKAIKYMKNQVKMFFAGESTCPMFFGCAQTGKGFETVLDSALSVYENWNLRVSTSLLNNWLNKLKRLTDNDYESLVKRQDILRIRFVTQVKTRPPTFAIFVNDKRMFKPHIVKFLTKKIIQEFKIYGVGIKLILKQTDKKDFRKKMLRLVSES